MPPPAPLPQHPIFPATEKFYEWLQSNVRPCTDIPSLQMIKIQEELGEAAEAYIGYLGVNPRKGSSHESTDVVNELADVIFTSIVAIIAMDYDPARVLDSRSRYLMNRIGL